MNQVSEKDCVYSILTCSFHTSEAITESHPSLLKFQIYSLELHKADAMFLNGTLLYAFVLACGKCHALLLGPILEGRAVYLGLFKILLPGSQF